MIKFLNNKIKLSFNIVKYLKYLSFLLVFLFPSKTWAFFSLDKTLIRLDEINRNESITIYNMENISHTYKIYLEHYQLLTNGSYIKLSKPIKFNFADKFLIYSPLSVTVQPHGYQVIRLQKKSMAAANIGEYISYLSIREIPKQAKQERYTSEYKINLSPIFKASVPVIITKGKLNSTYYIKNIELSIKKNTYNISTTLAVTGNKTIIGNLVVSYKNIILGTANNINLFFYVKERKVNTLIDKDILQKYLNKNLKISFISVDGTKTEKYFNLYTKND